MELSGMVSACLCHSVTCSSSSMPWSTTSVFSSVKWGGQASPVQTTAPARSLRRTAPHSCWPRPLGTEPPRRSSLVGTSVVSKCSALAPQARPPGTPLFTPPCFWGFLQGRRCPAHLEAGLARSAPPDPEGGGQAGTGPFLLFTGKRNFREVKRLARGHRASESEGFPGSGVAWKRSVGRG